MATHIACVATMAGIELQVGQTVHSLARSSTYAPRPTHGQQEEQRQKRPMMSPRQVRL